jgi:hypothetical protein
MHKPSALEKTLGLVLILLYGFGCYRGFVRVSVIPNTATFFTLLWLCAVLICPILGLVLTGRALRGKNSISWAFAPLAVSFLLFRIVTFHEIQEREKNTEIKLSSIYTCSDGARLILEADHQVILESIAANDKFRKTHLGFLKDGVIIAPYRRIFSRQEVDRVNAYIHTPSCKNIKAQLFSEVVSKFDTSQAKIMN